MKPMLKAPGAKRLKLKYDGPLSNCAFKFNVRRSIEETTLFALGMSLVAVLLISSVFILHPGTCVIVTVLIAMVEVELYGLLAWTGLKLNAVVMVNLVMSMGRGLHSFTFSST